MAPIKFFNCDPMSLDNCAAWPSSQASWSSTVAPAFSRSIWMFQTAVARFENAEGIRVDLIGAVHIADKAYYEKLNEDFKGYNALFDAFFASLDGVVTNLPTIDDGVAAMDVLEAMIAGIAAPGITQRVAGA